MEVRVPSSKFLVLRLVNSNFAFTIYSEPTVHPFFNADLRRGIAQRIAKGLHCSWFSLHNGQHYNGIYSAAFAFFILM